MNPPLPVELLVPADQRRLETALGSSRPLPASNAEECADVLRRPTRRVTVDEHHRFRETMARIQKPKPEVLP